MRLRTVVCASLALVGFAFNSILCRMALGPRLVDASTFTAVRLASGAVVLAALAGATGSRPRGALKASSFAAALALFAYAAAFSFAYLRLVTATGALVLFGAVQATMIGWALAHGERLRAGEWTGALLALGGLVALLLPGLSAPDPLGAASMALAGVAWGAYSLMGRSAKAPLAATAGNFARSLAFGAPLFLAAILARSVHASPRGLLLACASGALASGVGYTLWYAALPGLAAKEAAVVQLAAPVLAAAGGTLLVGERLSTRLVVCGAAILGGIAMVVLGRAKRR
jgi:drug/metabolite transporter (DMT)-like permease